MKKMIIKTGLSTSFLDRWEWIGVFSNTDSAFAYNPFVLGGDDYLHFMGLEIFERLEDAETGQHITVFGDEITVSDDITGNPSSRRDAVSLYFCSELGPHVRMDIIQHKGQTLVQFQNWDGKKPEVKE